MCVCVCVSPEVWTSVDQIKHLSRVEELFKAAQELDALVVAALRVDKDQQGAGTGWGASGLPEA